MLPAVPLTLHLSPKYSAHQVAHIMKLIVIFHTNMMSAVSTLYT